MKMYCIQKSVKSIALIWATVLFMGCGAGKMESTWTKGDYVDRKYDKLVVIGIGKNLAARSTFERDAVKLLREIGVNAVEGGSVFPPGLAQDQSAAKEYIEIIKRNGIDGVLTMALVDSNESERYQPGETQFVPSYYRFGRYIVRRQLIVETPGYYQTTRTYLIESVLYNVKGGLYEDKDTMVWLGQSSLIDPSSLESASKSFTKRMVNQLVADGIVETDEK